MDETRRVAFGRGVEIAVGAPGAGARALSPRSGRVELYADCDKAEKRAASRLEAARSAAFIHAVSLELKNLGRPQKRARRM